MGGMRACPGPWGAAWRAGDLSLCTLGIPNVPSLRLESHMTALVVGFFLPFFLRLFLSF